MSAATCTTSSTGTTTTGNALRSVVPGPDLQNALRQSYDYLTMICKLGPRVPTGQGKLAKVGEFDRSGKFMGNAESPGPSGKSRELQSLGRKCAGS